MSDFSATDKATSTEPCPAGKARNSTFSDEGTTCKKCDWENGEWQDEEGQSKCKSVPEGHFIVVGKC